MRQSEHGVAGCSTGEEVYSIAMCLLEFIGDTRKTCPIQIFGTDVSELAVEKARAGYFAVKPRLSDVSEERRQRFFQ